MGFYDDLRLFPMEKPEARTYLQERLEGRQIARLVTLETMDGCEGFGMELVQRSRLAFWAAPDPDRGKYTHRLVFRYIPPLKIITKEILLHFGMDRRSAGAGLPDALQERVEGQMIVGCSPTYEPGPHGGEVVTFEFRDGRKFRCEAVGPEDFGKLKRIRATIFHDLIEPQAGRVTFMPLIVPGVGRPSTTS